MDPQIPGNLFEGDLGRLDSFFNPIQKPGEFRGGNCFTPLAPFAPARGGEEFGDPSWFGWVGWFGNSNGCRFLGLTGFFVVGAHFLWLFGFFSQSFGAGLREGDWTPARGCVPR